MIYNDYTCHLCRNQFEMWLKILYLEIAERMTLNNFNYFHDLNTIVVFYR